MNKDVFNPVQEAAMRLAKRYGDFTMSRAKLLIWDTDKDTQSTVQSMLTTHMEVVALLTDLTLPANTPFINAKTYEFEVAKNLVEDVRESQADDDFDAELKDWDPGVHLQADHPLVSFLSDLGSRIKDYARHVTVYFHPSLIADMDEFEKWIVGIVKATKSPYVQYMMFDIYDTGVAKRLKGDLKVDVMVFNDKINLNKIMRDTLESETKDQPETPEKTFRAHLVNGITFLRENDQERGHEEIFKAYDIATENDWPDMRMSALLTFGNSIMGQDRYKEIEDTAKRIIAIGKENLEHDSKVVIINLLMQAYFMTGINNYTNKKWVKALEAYESAIEYSVLTGNRILEFEACRMAVSAADKLAEFDRAWEAGHRSLSIALEFPEEMRVEGTLPRLTKNLYPIAKRRSDREKEFVEHMRELFGREWRNYV